MKFSIWNRKRPFYLLFIVMAFGCQTGNHELIEEVLGSKTGHLRGLAIGSHPEQIKQAEPVEPKDEDQGYLFYEYIRADGNTFTLSYSFDDRGLFEIQVDIYTADMEIASDLYDGIKSQLKTRYGKTKEENDGYSLWLIASGSKEEIEITLINESPEYQNGKLSITVYDYSSPTGRFTDYLQ